MQENYAKANYEYSLKSNRLVAKAVPKLDVEELNYDRRALANKVSALRNQLAIDDSQIKQQRQKVLALKAAMNLAKINLDLTTVKAFSDGIVDNLYLSVGTPIIQHQPLFSFIDTNSLYIQIILMKLIYEMFTLMIRFLFFPECTCGVRYITAWSLENMVCQPTNDK